MERIVTSTVLPKDGGLPLLVWLAERFRYCDAPAWASLIGEGHLEVNGAPAEAGTILAAGDKVRFAPDSFEEPEVDTAIGIAYENADFLVLDKPANLPCHPGGRYFANTLWGIMKKEGESFHIATRLDRETSGLLLVCKTAGANRHARELQREGLIDKRYLVAVHGDFPDRLEAKGFLVHDSRSVVRKKRRFVAAAVETEGRPAGGDDPRFPDARAAGRNPTEDGESCETSFVRMKKEAGFSLVEAKLATGRNHQIRATMSSLGYPVVGDKLYGLDEEFFIRFLEGRLSSADTEALILPNQALHSASLSFPGLRGETISLRSDPPWPFPPRRERPE